NVNERPSSALWIKRAPPSAGTRQIPPAVAPAAGRSPRWSNNYGLTANSATFASSSVTPSPGASPISTHVVSGLGDLLNGPPYPRPLILTTDRREPLPGGRRGSWYHFV